MGWACPLQLPHRRRGRPTQRDRRFDGAFLREEEAHRRLAHRRQPAALSSRRAAPHRHHPHRPARRHPALGDPRRADRPAPRPPRQRCATRRRFTNAWKGMLEERITGLDAVAGPDRELHRLRLPVAEGVSAAQPERRARRAARSGAATFGASAQGFTSTMVEVLQGTPQHQAEVESAKRIRGAILESRAHSSVWRGCCSPSSSGPQASAS